MAVIASCIYYKDYNIHKLFYVYVIENALFNGLCLPLKIPNAVESLNILKFLHAVDESVACFVVYIDDSDEEVDGGDAGTNVVFVGDAGIVDVLVPTVCVVPEDEEALVDLDVCGLVGMVDFDAKNEDCEVYDF